MAIQIPKRHIPGLAKIRQLPAEAFERLIFAMSPEPDSYDGGRYDRWGRITKDPGKSGVYELAVH